CPSLGLELLPRVHNVRFRLLRTFAPQPEWFPVHIIYIFSDIKFLPVFLNSVFFVMFLCNLEPFFHLIISPAINYIILILFYINTNALSMIDRRAFDTMTVNDDRSVYMQSLQGKNAIVTGGNRGIGYHTVLRLANEGVNVAIIGRDQGALDTAEKNLADTGVKVLSLKADVADEADVKDAVTKISSEFD